MTWRETKDFIAKQLGSASEAGERLIVTHRGVKLVVSYSDGRDEVGCFGHVVSAHGMSEREIASAAAGVGYGRVAVAGGRVLVTQRISRDGDVLGMLSALA